MPQRAEAGDEHQTPDHGRRADDQDPRLAQRLAEEPEHAQAQDIAHDLPVKRAISPVAASHSRGIASSSLT